MAFTTEKPLNQKKPSLLSEYWWVGGLIGFFLIIAGSYIIRIFFIARAPLEQPNTWNKITPGFSRLVDLENYLGQPIKTTNIPEGKQLDYASEFPAIPNQVIVDDNNTVVFVKEPVPLSAKQYLADYKQQFGEPDLKLFKPYSSGRDAYVYLKQGLVIIVHFNFENVEEKWYFKPTDKDRFLQSWGKNLDTKTDGPEQFESLETLQ